MKRILKIFTLVVVLVFSASCKIIGDITPHDYKVKNLNPTSMTSINGTILVELTNTGSQITLTDVSGELYKGDLMLGTFNVGEVVIPAKGRHWIELNGDVALGKDVSLFSLLSLAQNVSASDYSDYYVTVRGVGQIWIFKKKLLWEKKSIQELLN